MEGEEHMELYVLMKEVGYPGELQICVFLERGYGMH